MARHSRVGGNLLFTALGSRLRGDDGITKYILNFHQSGEPAKPLSGEDIDAALDLAGVTFEPGDALLLAMGRDRYEAAGHDYSGLRGGGMVPGAGTGVGRWLVEHDASMLCWDFLDSNHPDEPLAVVHLLIWAIGLLLVDNCDLSRAVAHARSTGVYTAGLVVAPIAVPGGTGCLVDPKLLL